MSDIEKLILSSNMDKKSIMVNIYSIFLKQKFTVQDVAIIQSFKRYLLLLKEKRIDERSFLLLFIIMSSLLKDEGCLYKLISIVEKCVQDKNYRMMFDRQHLNRMVNVCSKMLLYNVKPKLVNYIKYVGITCGLILFIIDNDISGEEIYDKLIDNFNSYDSVRNAMESIYKYLLLNITNKHRST